MALHWQPLILLLLHLHSGVLVSSSPIEKNAQEAQDLYAKYRPQIWSVIDDLNADPERQYNYNFSDLLNTQKKTDDVTFIEIEVVAECYAQSKSGCSNTIFTCKAYVEYFANTNSFETLPGLDCQEKIQVTEGEPVLVETTTKEQTSSSPPVLKPGYCPGCTVDLDTNVPGVENLITTALHHLEAEKTKKHVSVRVLRLQREIVSGVKFILLLEVAPTVCDAHLIENPPICAIDSDAALEVCRIEFIQKPWISDDKHIIGNNCTKSQDFAAVSVKKNRNDFDNEIDVNNEYKKSAEIPEAVPESPNYEKMAETGNLEPELSPARLLDLDAQIIPTDPTDATEPLLSVRPLEVETTKFGMDNSQLAVEDVPSLPTSTDSFVASETVKPIKELPKDESSSESEESTESVEDRHKRQTTTDASSSSEESDEKKTEAAAGAQQTVVGTTDPVLQRQKRSDESSSSSSSDSDEKHKRKRKKYQQSPCDAGDDVVDCPYKKNNVQPAACNDFDNDPTNDCIYQSTKTVPVKKTSQPCKYSKKKGSSSSSSSDSTENDCNNRDKRNVNEYNAEKELVDELAKFAGESLDDDTWKHEVLEVVRVKKLELEGAVYHMVVRFAATKCNEIGECFPFENDKLCKLVIHYSKDHAKLLKSRCHQIERDVDKNRTKRAGLGAPSDATKDPEMVTIAKQTLVKLDSKSSHDNKYKIVKIHSASRQVVSGFLFKLKVDIIESDCLKNDNKDSSLCGEKEAAVPKTCDIVIWDQSWLPQGTETNVTCDQEHHTFRSRRSIESHRTKRQVPGAPIDSTNDPDMLKLAKETLVQLDSKSSQDNKYKIVKIHEASKQVVAGVLYKLKVDIVESNCPKHANKDSELCEAKKEATVKTCHIKIWDQPWLPHGKETNVTCDEEHHTFRSKRSASFDSGLSIPEQFLDFQKKYDKKYATLKEINYRFSIFMENMKKAEELQKHEQGSAIYGASRFADLHPAEFRQYLGYRPELRDENAIPYGPAKIPEIDLPTEFDWRTKGAVTHVKDQGQCGSCWAFSVTGNVEGQYAIKHDKLLEFSEQELVDCDKMDEGCNGGLMDNAYRAIEELGGLELESDYPYDAEDEKCVFKPSLTRVKLSGAVNVSQNEDDMAKFLVKNGPISIGINANAMQLYMGGVSHPPKFLCDPDSMDHGVLIVGYGVHKYKLFNKTLPYWIVKNSWGPRWGEQGYYRVYRGDGTCGVNKMASSAIVE